MLHHHHQQVAHHAWRCMELSRFCMLHAMAQWQRNGSNRVHEQALMAYTWSAQSQQLKTNILWPGD